ncbi:MAG: hypothetical protein JWL76_1099 [Thermoleophilia bacterium]|nr:hypothetical protein [Thermoleophilia bacterium]
MSGFGAHHGSDPGASWRALSGEPLPEVPSLSQPPAAPPADQAPADPAPVHGGWQQAWQDEHGQWHSPYAAMEPQQAPPYAGAEQLYVQPQPAPHEYAMPAQPVAVPVDGSAAAPAPAVAPVDVIIPTEQLAPVGPPRYLAPTHAARDPRQRTMAAVITFVALLIGLWGILGFLGSLSHTLSGIASGNQKLKIQMQDANKGLVDLDVKTRNLETMSSNSKKMQGLLTGIDTDMGTMLEGVNGIAEGMSSMASSLETLDGELGKVNEINSGMATQLGGINAGLQNQVVSVRTMRKDVEATSRVLKSLPGRLTATNKRLAYVNNAVNIMGCRGITNNLKVKISLGPIPNGSATVYATVVPPGAWGTKEDGKTPC